MSRVVAIDEYTIPYRPADVQRVLLQAHSYRDWWPKPFRFDVDDEPPVREGTRVRVRLGPLMSWSATLRSVAPDRIELDYGPGAWRGTARWTLREVLDGTAVVYRMDVEPGPLWLRLALLRLDARRRQTRRLNGVFKALSARLEATGAARVPEPTGPPSRPPSDFRL